jgi:hypothetical protein
MQPPTLYIRDGDIQFFAPKEAAEMKAYQVEQAAQSQ